MGACYYKFWKGAGRRLSDFDVVGKSKLVNGLKHSTCLRTPLTSLLLHASPQTLQPPWASLRLTASGASCRAALPACLLTRSRALHFCASCMPSPRPSYPSRLWYGQQSTYFGGGAPFTREKAANKGMHWLRRCTHSANTMPLPLQTSNCAPESAGRPSSTTSTWSPCRHARARHYMSPQPGNALCQAASKARIAKTGEVAQAHGRSPNGSCEPRQRHWRRQGKGKRSRRRKEEGTKDGDIMPCRQDREGTFGERPSLCEQQRASCNSHMRSSPAHAVSFRQPRNGLGGSPGPQAGGTPTQKNQA